MRTSREEWRKRVERWKDSGLTAQQYATELGIKASTLQYWKHKLGKPEPAPGRKAERAAQAQALPSLIELQPIVTASAAAAFELELEGGRRLRIPVGFDVPSLERLLDVLARTA
jgi:hypothetical protein